MKLLSFIFLCWRFDSKAGLIDWCISVPIVLSTHVQYTHTHTQKYIGKASYTTYALVGNDVK